MNIKQTLTILLPVDKTSITRIREVEGLSRSQRINAASSVRLKAGIALASARILED